MAVHMWNVGVGYERARRGAITKEAQIRNERDLAEGRGWHYGMAVHRVVAARNEERAFYAEVPLTDEDRGLVYCFGLNTPADFREIVRRLNGDLGRRQTRRALHSLASRGAVTAEVRPRGRGRRTARVFTAVPPQMLP